MHVKNRDHVRDFLTYFFFPYYSFPLEHNLIYYIAGRFEYSNKGFDVLVDALGKLNERMKKDKDDDRTVTVFFFTPLANRGIKQSVEENRHYYNHIKDHLEKHTDDIMDKLLLDVISQQCSMEESIFTNDYLKEVKQKLKLFQREGNPPISTHDIADREENPLLQNLLDNGLDNHRDDPVKVIVYPVYLDGDDGLLDLQYYDALSAGHFGLYPSYYEPWGYTPVESMSLGVPALTTDLAGFGRFIKPKTLDENPGIYILDRYDNTTDEVVDQLYEIMYDFAQNDHAERVQNKINAKQMSMLTDWEHFVKNYIEAHNKALDA
jgi:glycogen(starch) synthase